MTHKQLIRHHTKLCYDIDIQEQENHYEPI